MVTPRLLRRSRCDDEFIHWIRSDDPAQALFISHRPATSGRKEPRSGTSEDGSHCDTTASCEGHLATWVPCGEKTARRASPRDIRRSAFPARLPDKYGRGVCGEKCLSFRGLYCSVSGQHEHSYAWPKSERAGIVKTPKFLLAHATARGFMRHHGGRRTRADHDRHGDGVTGAVVDIQTVHVANSCVCSRPHRILIRCFPGGRTPPKHR